METMNSEIHLKRRPVGLPVAEDFELVTAPVPQPGEGEVLVRNIYMSVDPYMRARMLQRKTYISSFEIGGPLSGGCVGQVVASNNASFPKGDYVMSMKGWREYSLSDGKGLNKIDPRLAPIQAYLGVLGMPGWTAYVGLLDIGKPKEGDTVYVSAASGAVGSVVCQIAEMKGCRVVGSAGSKEKVAWLLDEAGVDAAFNYKEVENLTATLANLCPNGIEVYFDNVGGTQLEAALNLMNDFGRIVACGMISLYCAASPPSAPRNLGFVVTKRLTMQGFIITDHYDRLPAFQNDMAQWIANRDIVWRETVVEGIQKAPEAFIGLFKGENFGKMLVKVGPDPAI